MSNEITDQNRYGIHCLLKVIDRTKQDVGTDSRTLVTLLIDICEILIKAVSGHKELVDECESIMERFGNEKLLYKDFLNLFKICEDIAKDTIHPNAQILCKTILNTTDEETKFISHLIFEMNCPILRSFYSMNERRYTIMIGEAYTYKRIDTYTTTECSLVYKMNSNFQFHPILQNIIAENDFSVEMFQQKFFPSSKIPKLTTSDFDYMKDKIDECFKILNASRESDQPTNIMFWGEPGTGKTELALSLVKEAGFIPILIGEKDTSGGIDDDVSRHFRMSNLLIAQTLFKNDKNVVLIFDEMDDIIGNSYNKHSKITLNRIMETNKLPILWIMNEPEEYLDKSVRRRVLFNVKFEPFPVKIKKNIWSDMAKTSGVDISDEQLTVISNRYEATPSIISNVLRVHKATGRDIVSVVKDNNDFLNFGDVKKSFKDVDVKGYNFDYINPDADVKKIGLKLFEKGRNFSLCLYGPPGTGKSEFAKYLAYMTGIDVLYKRASDLKNMYVGQTEKLIAAAFDQAEKDNSLLLIDEADTFIQNRDMLKGHEKQFVNEMLSQMESRRVKLVMTTNTFAEIDDAAMRRFDFKIKFDFMRTEQVGLMFKDIFGYDPSREILKLDNITPADIMIVKEKMDLLDITDLNEIERLLKSESDYKNRHTPSKIGFRV